MSRMPVSITDLKNKPCLPLFLTGRSGFLRPVTATQVTDFSSVSKASTMPCGSVPSAPTGNLTPNCGRLLKSQSRVMGWTRHLWLSWTPLAAAICLTWAAIKLRYFDAISLKSFFTKQIFRQHSFESWSRWCPKQKLFRGFVHCTENTPDQVFQSDEDTHIADGQYEILNLNTRF